MGLVSPTGKEKLVARTASGRPTDLELEILKALWKLGSGSVREVWEVLSKRRPIGYTTVLKMLQIMTDKELVLCDKREKVHIYRPRQSYRTVAKRFTEDLLERVYEGSAGKLMLHALESRKVKPKELVEIRGLLEELEKRGKEK
jgi:BlaI family transcriptional regulator, penicillinase repressor